MDEHIQQRLDQLVEDEVRAGLREVSLPDEYYAILKADRAWDPQIPLFRRIRFRKLTPKIRRQINEAVIKRYHADLKNPDLLSMEQIRKLNIERGEWSAELENKLRDLQEETGRLSRDLYLDGMDQEQQHLVRLGELTEEFQKHLTGIEDVELRNRALRIFQRWLEYTPEVQDAYTTAYAAEQELEAYSFDRDLARLYDVSLPTEAFETLQQIQDERDHLERYVTLLKKRKDLLDLQVKQAKMFTESVEQRRDTCEEMARLFFCTQVMHDGKDQFAPIMTTLDDLWLLPDEIIQWLLIEIYFFLNGIPDEARPYLQSMGFLLAPRSSGAQPASGEQPEEPSSNPASLPVTATPVPSTVAATSTT